MKQFFRTKYSWNSVYHHFQKWSKHGSWERAWSALLQKYRGVLDMSSVQLDGTHTPAKRGGQAVGYQGRKKCRTSNGLNDHIKVIETSLDELVRQDESLNQQSRLLQTVTGIGKVLCWNLLYKTNGFRSISDPVRWPVTLV